MKKKSTIPPKRTGRPTKYTDALADEICRRIAEGEMLMQIVRDEHMPERKTVYNWMNAVSYTHLTLPTKLEV